MEISNQLSQFFQANPFVSGGLSVAVMSYALNTLRTAPPRALRFFRERLLTTVQINQNTAVYDYFGEYIIETMSRKYKHSLVATDHSGTVIFRPRSGVSKWILFEGHPILIQVIDPSDGAQLSPGEGGGLSDVLRLYKPNHLLLTFYSFDKELPFRFISGICQRYSKPVQDYPYIGVYSSQGRSWDGRADIKMRAVDSVILHNGVIEEIIADASRFLSQEQKYDSRGIPYHRGYLLSGPPGNGKTSLIHALASKFRMDVFRINLSDLKYDSDLGALIKGTNRIYLFEDIDCLFDERRSKDSGVTFSGLLNAMDGLDSPRSCLYFMTTNHPNNLDPALVRAGRIDRHFVIGNATGEQAERLFLKFFPGQIDRALAFANLVPYDRVSMGSLQELLLENENAPDEAVEAARRMWCVCANTF